MDTVRRTTLLLILWGCYSIIASILGALDFGVALEELKAAMPVVSTLILAVFLAGFRYFLIRRSTNALMTSKMYRVSTTVGMVGGIGYFLVTFLSQALNSSEWILPLGIIVGLLLAGILMIDLVAGILLLIQFKTIPADLKLESGEVSLKIWSFFVSELKEILKSIRIGKKKMTSQEKKDATKK